MRRAGTFRLATAASGLAAALAAVPRASGAEDFAVAVSPPRFELSVKAGETSRQVVEISNAAPSAAVYTMKTADWTLDRNAGAVFSEDLQSGSCRPWVAIERHQITVAGRGSYRFRFEVTPPPTAPRGECRFAILIDGQETDIRTKSGVTVPVAGRIGIIVYVVIGQAQPLLTVTGGGVATVNGEATPVLAVTNAGDAHGRLEGFLSGVDARGAKIDFEPATLPILPNETRMIPLNVDQPDKSPRTHIAFPITIRGRLSWSGGSTNFSQQFSP